MLVLALDTSTPAVTAGTVALGSEPDVLSSRVTVDPRAHGELLMPHVTDALGDAGVSLGHLDAIVCGVGPGPYTGLRAGVVTATALAHSLGVPAYPVCSLDAIAADVPTGGSFAVLSDARRREVYWARYSGTGVREEGPHVAAPDSVRLGDVARVAGHGARIYDTVLAGSGVGATDPMYPAPRGLVRVAAGEIRAAEEPAELSPLYLRRPHAQQPGERKRVSS